jgi:flagellar basal body-associated protein FliL
MKVIITRTLNGLQPVFDSAPQLNHIDFKSSEYDERKFILPYLDINGLPLFRISLHSEYIMYSLIKFTTDSTNDRGFYSINLFYRSDTLIQNFAEILSIIDKKYVGLAPGIVDPNFLTGFNESKILVIEPKYIHNRNEQIIKKGILLNFQRQSFKIEEEFAYIPYLTCLYLFENTRLDLASILKSDEINSEKIDYIKFKSSILKKEIKGDINSVEFMLDNEVYTERAVKDVLFFALNVNTRLKWRYKVDKSQGGEIINSQHIISKYNPPRPQPNPKIGQTNDINSELNRLNNNVTKLKSSNKIKTIILTILGVLLLASIGFNVWQTNDKSELEEKISSLEAESTNSKKSQPDTSLLSVPITSKPDSTNSTSNSGSSQTSTGQSSSGVKNAANTEPRTGSKKGSPQSGTQSNGPASSIKNATSPGTGNTSKTKDKAGSTGGTGSNINGDL